MPAAVVLLSGGLDSTTAAALARHEGWAVHALTVRYGQVHDIEIEAARRVAAALGAVRHVELDVDLATFGGSSLLRTSGVTPEVDTRGPIPPTYVPARNTILLSLAMGWAEVIGAERIVIGVNALDYSGYPDCRPEYIAAFEYMASLATRAGVEGRPLRIWAPLQNLTKAGIIRVGLELGVDYALTHSCYEPGPDGAPCRRCDSCRLRARGFDEVGIEDPLNERFREPRTLNPEP
jgi:7-cyano-7-deazaguanine synthase